MFPGERYQRRELFDDLGSQRFRLQQILAVRQSAVPKPQEVEIQLAGDQVDDQAFWDRRILDLLPGLLEPKLFPPFSGSCSIQAEIMPANEPMRPSERTTSQRDTIRPAMVTVWWSPNPVGSVPKSVATAHDKASSAVRMLASGTQVSTPRTTKLLVSTEITIRAKTVATTDCVLSTLKLVASP